MNAASREAIELFGYAMLVLSIGLFGYAAVLARRVKRWLDASVATIGRVVATSVASTDGRRAYRVVVASADAAGAAHTFTSRASNTDWKDATGQEIAIVYVRNNPSDARVYTWWVQWMQPAMLAGTGAIGIAVVVGLLSFG